MNPAGDAALSEPRLINFPRQAHRMYRRDLLRPVRFTLLCLAGTTAPGLAAAPGDDAAATIVVTGRGLAESPSDAVYDIVTIDRDRLANAPSNRMEDVLGDVPGFQLFRRSDSSSANPTSQGATLRALGGNASSRALLLFDGVPQSDPFGGWITWPAFDPRRLGRVRVVRGGGSGVAGPGALSGTIEMESAAPDDLEGVRAGIDHGSRDSVDAFAGVGVHVGEGFVSLSGAYARGDGFVPIVAAQRGPADRPAPYRQGTLALRAITPIGADLELQANVDAFDDRRERGTAFSAVETKGTDASLRLVGGGALPFSLLAYVQTRQFYNSFASVNDGRTAATQVAEQYNVPSTGLGARGEIRPLTGPVELRLGADWRETEGRTQERFSFVDGAGTRGRVAGGRTDTYGALAELTATAGAITLTGGGRIDRWEIAPGFLRERMLGTGAPLTDTVFPSRGGWEPTGRAGLAWRASEMLTLRAAAYRGWRLPTLNELYRPFRAGPDATAANADLSPERLDGVEAGVDLHPLPHLRFGATLFANRLNDAIANITLGEGPGTFPEVGFVGASGTFSQRGNLGAVTSRGVEVDATYDLGRWHLSAGYSFADAGVKADGPAMPLDGLRPAQTPRHSAVATIAWADPGGAYASVTARYVGNQYEDDRNTQRIPDALTFDAVARWPIGRRLSIALRGENLANARVVAGIAGDDLIERANPRTLWIGLRWQG